MTQPVAKLQLPWVMLGDLNEIVEAKEKFGGRSIWCGRLHLKDFMLKVGGIDIGYSGIGYT